MSNPPHESEAGNQPGEPDAEVDVSPIVAAYGAEVLRLIDLPSMPLDDVAFELQRIPEWTRGSIFRLVVHARKTENNDALPEETGGDMLTVNKARPAVSETQKVMEIGTLPVDTRRGRIGTIVLSEDDRELLDEKRKLMPARTRLSRAWQMVTRLWERWTYSDRPDYLNIADIKEILRRHNNEKKEAERAQLSMVTLGKYWNASGMLLELLNSRYGYLGANEREKLEIRWYLLEKAGYTPGAS